MAKKTIMRGENELVQKNAAKKRKATNEAIKTMKQTRKSIRKEGTTQSKMDTYHAAKKNAGGRGAIQDSIDNFTAFDSRYNARTGVVSGATKTATRAKYEAEMKQRATRKKTVASGNKAAKAKKVK